MEALSRRKFIRMGISAALAFFITKMPLKLFPANSTEEDWVMPGEGRIIFISGEVRVNGIRVDIGDPLKEGDVLETGENSEAEIEIRDYAIFHVKANSTVQIEDIFKSPRINVKKGWFLIKGICDVYKINSSNELVKH